MSVGLLPGRHMIDSFPLNLPREETSMQFGLFMMPLHPPERSFVDSYERDLAQIVLATGVTLLALHNPVEVAHRIAMLDHLARGRFYWGIGGGAIPTDL